jgi:hypothetical protein
MDTLETLELEIQRGTTFGPIELLCTGKTNEAVPLAGWSAVAQSRKTTGGELVLDLLPVIKPDDADGLITLSEVPWENTINLPKGDHPWDLLLVDPTGRRLPRFFKGRLKIHDIITQPTT